MTLDEGDESTDAGMLALQAWCVGKDGPDAEMVNSQLFSLNAGLVALQASLSFMPDNSVVEKLKERFSHHKSPIMYGVVNALFFDSPTGCALLGQRNVSQVNTASLLGQLLSGEDSIWVKSLYQ